MSRTHFNTSLAFEYQGARTYTCRLSPTVVIQLEFRSATHDVPSGWWVSGLGPMDERAGTSVHEAAQLASNQLAALIESRFPA